SCPKPRDLYDAGEIIRLVYCDGLEPYDLTVSVARRRQRRGVGDLFPTAYERAEWVAEGHVVAVGVQRLKWFRITSHDLAQRAVTLVNRSVKTSRCHSATSSGHQTHRS